MENKNWNSSLCCLYFYTVCAKGKCNVLIIFKKIVRLNFVELCQNCMIMECSFQANVLECMYGCMYVRPMHQNSINRIFELSKNSTRIDLSYVPQASRLYDFLHYVKVRISCKMYKFCPFIGPCSHRVPISCAQHKQEKHS